MHRAAAAAALLFAACKPPGLAFPDGFLWGTAGAGFQVDMGCPSAPCDDPNSDWWQWTHSEVTRAKALVSADRPEDGPGEWEMYEADADLAKAMGHNAFRLSIEWSRIFPNSTESATTPEEIAARADAAAVQRYHKLFAALKQRGLKPLVTLHHYTMPLWVHDGIACHQDKRNCAQRGWMGDTVIAEIAKYAGFCAREFGGEVDLWATLNEPFAVVLSGFLAFPGVTAERTNPPGIADVPAAVAALNRMIVAHARMYDAVRAGDTRDADGDGKPAQVGVVHAIAAVKGETPDRPEDAEAARRTSYVFNEVFLNGTIRGEMDEDLDGVRDAPRADLADRMDFIGVNYYTRVTVQATTFPLYDDPNTPGDDYPMLTFLPVQVWEDYPAGIGEAVRLAGSYARPVIITENGADDPEGVDKAPKYLVAHLRELHKAIQQGADVRGYFYWSLVDNFEWSQGFKVKMGLYRYDGAARARTAKAAADAYAQIAKSNVVLDTLLKKWAPEN
jgi:beta-glucosidase/6-phospho-beta-glucosidase/beta-galactosidase